MAFDVGTYLNNLKAAGIAYEKGTTGQYKDDYYICAGSMTPHIHVSDKGTFVGLKKKQGAMTTLVHSRFYKRANIESEINEYSVSATPNDTAITNALRILGRMEKAERA